MGNSVVKKINHCLHGIVGVRFVQGTAPSHVSIPPKSKWHDGHRRVHEAGKCIRESTALRTKFRGDVRVQVCHAAVYLEFAFGRLGVITIQVS